MTTTPSTRRGGLGLEFGKLWAASAVSNLSDGVALVAAPLLAASLTERPALIAGLTFAQRLPWLLFTLLSGALADRLDRRRAMALVAAWRATLFAVLGATVLLDWASLPLLYVLFFLLSTGETLFDTASVALVPALVPPEELPRANARLGGTVVVTNHFLGRPLGGVLFGIALALPFLVGAGGLLASATVLLTVRGSFRADRAGGTRTGLRHEIAEGLRWLWRQRVLRTLALSLALLDLTVIAQNAVLVLFARERLGLGPGGFGVLVGMHAAGAVLGSAVAGRVVAWLGRGRVLRLGLLFEVAVPLALALTRHPLQAYAAYAVFGCHAMVWGAVIMALRQELTPDRLRGRVESAYQFLAAGGSAPGALVGGLLAARAGLVAPFWFGAATALLLTPFVWSAFADASVASRWDNNADSSC